MLCLCLSSAWGASKHFKQAALAQSRLMSFLDTIYLADLFEPIGQLAALYSLVLRFFSTPALGLGNVSSPAGHIFTPLHLVARGSGSFITDLIVNCKPSLNAAAVEDTESSVVLAWSDGFSQTLVPPRERPHCSPESTPEDPTTGQLQTSIWTQSSEFSATANFHVREFVLYYIPFLPGLH